MSNNLPEILKEQEPGTLELGGARMAFLDIKEGFWGIRRQMEALIGNHLTSLVLQQAGANGGASFARSFADQSGLEKSAALAACVMAYQAAGFGNFEITSIEWPLGVVRIQANDAFEAWMYKQQQTAIDKPVCAYTAGVFVGFVNILGDRQDVVCIEHSCQAKGDENCIFELLPASQAKDETVVPYLPDPGLGRQINLLEMLFERMPMGIAVLDLDYRIQRFNPTWIDFSKRYAPPSAEPLVPGVSYFNHLPGTEPMVLPLFKRVLAGETVQQNSVYLESEGIVTYWDVVLAPLFEQGKVVGILNVAVDATEREMLQQNLEKRVEERTHELKTLLKVSQDINSTLELDNLLNVILDQLKNVVDYSGASILILEGDSLSVRIYRGPVPRDEAQQLIFPLRKSPVNDEVIRQQRPLIISDVRSESTSARMFQQTAADNLHTTFGYVRSWLGVPLMVKGKILGMLTLDHNQPDHFSNQHANLVLAFANQAAVAIENARLYLETERRAQENEALFSVQQAITSKLEMDEVLQMIADQARRITNTDISAVYLLKGNELEIAYVSGDVPQEILGYRLAVDDSIAGQVIKNREVILVPDTWEDPRVDRDASDQVQARSLLIVPMISGEEILGTITVANRTPGGFIPEDERLLTRLATSVVISLENARLYRAELDRREVAESMRDIMAVLNSSQSLPETLKYIVERASQVMASQACLIHKIDYEQGFVSIEASYGLPQDLQLIRGFPLHSSPKADNQILNRNPVWVADFKKLPSPPEEDLKKLDPNVRAWRALTNQHYRSWVAVPLVIAENVYGSLAFYFKSPKAYNEEEIRLSSAFADQAALAIENTRLYEAAEQAAITSERNRLARDLHDAVTQTLFSASMIADVLPKIWERKPEEGHRRLEELRQLTRGALSEMRTLLVELRPAALVDTDLEDLIGHQVNAFNARTRLPVTFESTCIHNPPTEIKEMMYRLVQEAFNNISKHADASEVRVGLDCQDGKVILEIKDNGIGFDLDVAKREGLGLGIMAERVRNVGAQLEVHSQIGKGTKLKIIWDQPIKEKDND